MIKLKFFFHRKYSFQREIPAHAHDCYEFVYYRDGQGESRYGDGQTFFFDKDSYILYPPNTPHDEKHYGFGRIVAAGFELTDERLRLGVSGFTAHNPYIDSLIQKIGREFYAKDFCYEEVIGGLLYELVVRIARDVKTVKLNTPTAINYMVSYLDEYFMAKIDLDELASSLGYCEDHFRILFKRHTGRAPKEYIQEKRLQRAKELLADPSLSLEEISLNCGFEYYSQFSSFFKKAAGANPLKYRKELRDMP
ncbi:MAG: helix-turn-helix domain-containing protein [Clostridiales bacterium]|jgi:AraC-like DNA-binding protein|nr:helix-turn-helix domain-containing protein [Clostridiales bacterium]